jgi:DNA invertase Pin-like site-specific DNA recombinase
VTGRVYGYMRVSTDQQADSGLGLGAQRAAILQEASRRGWRCVEYVEDGGWSGSNLDRPGIAALLPRLRRGDVLVIAKLDRLSRSLVDAAGLLQDAQRRGWVLVAIDLGLDLGTPTGRLVASVMAAVASWERETIGQRTRDSMAVAKKRGRRFGHPSSLPAAVLDRIETERGHGDSLRVIAERLMAEQVPTAQGCATWHPSTVRSALLSRANDRQAGIR